MWLHHFFLEVESGLFLEEVGFFTLSNTETLGLHTLLVECAEEGAGNFHGIRTLSLIW